MNKIWHNVSKWEDIGMWREINADEKQKYYQIAVEFTGNHQLYGQYMMMVLDSFPFSCEHNLTDIGMNRRAWIGHAACYLATECPEYVTRSAWSALTDEQRFLANAEADKAIKEWETRHERKNTRLDKEMGIQRLF